MSHVLVQDNAKPYFTGQKIIVPNQPQLLGEDRHGPQVTLALGLEVFYQADLPRVDDFTGWQAVVMGCRTCRNLQGHEKLAFRLMIVQRGLILYDVGAPFTNDYNQWQVELNRMRMAVATSETMP